MTEEELDKLISILLQEKRNFTVDEILNSTTSLNPSDLAIWAVYELAVKTKALGIKNANIMELKLLQAFYEKYAG